MAQGEPAQDGGAVGRARKLNAEGDFTVEEFEALCEKYGKRCLRCGREDILLTPDHVVPLSLGGGNLVSNIQPLCGGCNSWKNDKAADHRPDVILDAGFGRAADVPSGSLRLPAKPGENGA